MEIAIKIIQFIASFSLLVLIHELGHYLFARMFGIKVDKFYLFFNPWFSLVKFNYKGTEYGIGWLPFGGYCKIAGMVDESMDTESLKKEPQPYEFRTKPAWQRLLVMLGGVLMNVLLALLVYIGISYAWGDDYLDNAKLVDGSHFNELAHQVGFQEGDRIVSVDGEQYEDYFDIYPAMVINMAHKVEVMRGGQPAQVTIDGKFLPKMVESKDFMVPRVPFLIGPVAEDGGAKAAGVHEGDRPVAVNGEPMRYHNQFVSTFRQNASKSVELTLERDSAGFPIQLTLPVVVNAEGMIGVSNAGLEQLPFATHTYTLLQSIPAGFERTGTELANYGKQLKMIFNPKTEAYKSLGGLVAIGSIFPTTWSWSAFWHITAFLSIVLAVMNLIPLPGLDGGHVVFLLWEVVTGRKPSDKFLEWITTVGLFILLALIVYANGNDVYRFFIK